MMSVEQQANQSVTAQPVSPAVTPSPEQVVTVSAARVHGDARWMAGALRGVGGACGAATIAAFYGYATLPIYWFGTTAILLTGTGWFLDRYAVSTLKRSSV